MNTPKEIVKGKYRDFILNTLDTCKRNRNKKLDGKFIRGLDTGYTLSYCDKNVTESHLVFLQGNQCILVLPSKMYTLQYKFNANGVSGGPAVFHGYFSMKTKTFFVDHCNMIQGVTFSSLSFYWSILLFHYFKVKFTVPYRDVSLAHNHILIKTVKTVSKFNKTEYLLFMLGFRQNLYVVFAHSPDSYETSLWWTADNKLANTAVGIVLGRRGMWSNENPPTRICTLEDTVHE